MNETPQVRFSQDVTPKNREGAGGSKTTPFRSRRFTPYTKTPKSRNVKRSTAQPRSPPTENRENVFKEIVNQTWRVYNCSPLYNFSYRSNDIRAYSRLLSVNLEAESHKGIAFGGDQGVADKASITVVKGLKGLCDSGPDALQIILKKKLNTGKQNGSLEPKIVLTAIMCCVIHSSEPLATVNKAFTLLPLMLVKGPVGLTKQLHSWLMQTFDCVISNANFTPVQLNWTIALWAGELMEKNARPVELLYETPSEVEGINRITIDIEPKDCKRLWDNIHDHENDEVTDEEVQLFIKALEAHFYHHFQITLFAMPMMRVGTSIVYLSADGRIKIFSKEHVGQVLAHLTDLLLEQRLSAAL